MSSAQVMGLGYSAAGNSVVQLQSQQLNQLLSQPSCLREVHFQSSPGSPTQVECHDHAIPMDSLAGTFHVTFV